MCSCLCLHFFEVLCVVCSVQCVCCGGTTEQEQSSLYIVQNKLLISSSDSVETKKLQICLCDSDCVSTVGVASNRKIQLIVRMDDSRRKIMDR